MAADLSRYDRQMLLPGIGAAGQRRLLESTAVVLGCGALGSVAADGLARAGVGRLVIADRDFIETTNLQRQVLFDEQDIADGLPKAEAARRKLARINSQVEVTAVVDDINAANVARHARGADILMDGLDNFETRYLANDLAVKHGIPYVYGGAVGTVGMAFTILPRTTAGDAPWESVDAGGATPCLRCLFPEAPGPGQAATCDTAGVLGPAPAMIAGFQVAEALKILTSNHARVCRTLFNLDLWNNGAMHLETQAVPDCPCCGERHFDYLDGRAGAGAIALCGRDAVQLNPGGDAALDLQSVAGRLRRFGEVAVNEFMLRAALTDQGQAYELVLFGNGRAIIKGTGEAGVARGVYAKFVGN